jgi:hypothetical protein
MKGEPTQRAAPHRNQAESTFSASVGGLLA